MAPGGLGSRLSVGGRGGVALLSTGGVGTAAASVCSSWRSAGPCGPSFLGLGSVGRRGRSAGHVQQAPSVSGIARPCRGGRVSRRAWRRTAVGYYGCVGGSAESKSSHIRKGASAQMTRKAHNLSLLLLCPAPYIPPLPQTSFGNC